MLLVSSRLPQGVWWYLGSLIKSSSDVGMPKLLTFQENGYGFVDVWRMDKYDLTPDGIYLRIFHTEKGTCAWNERA
jgi:hypothetical protein